MLRRSATVVCWEGDTRWYWYVIDNVIIHIRELPFQFLKLLSYLWAFFQFFPLYNQCKFCETKKMLCYLLTISALHRHNCWYQLCVIMVIFHFWVEHWRKYASHQKKVSNISCSELNFVQKSTRARICLPPSRPPRVELGCSKDWQIQCITMYWNGKLY